MAEEHLMGTNGSLSALHGDEGGGGGLVVCTDCQQLHSSDTLEDPCKCGDDECSSSSRGGYREIEVIE